MAGLPSLSDAAESPLAWGVGIAVLFEVGVHILVHYTVPGATAASELAKFMAPGLDAVGLTTVFSDASAVADTQLPALDSLVPEPT